LCKIAKVLLALIGRAHAQPEARYVAPAAYQALQFLVKGATAPLTTFVAARDRS
jgi:hypothetical protein